MSAAAAALWAGRPERALKLLREIDPRSDLSWSGDSTQFQYWNDYTEALHMLRRHDEELALTDHISPAVPLIRAWLRGRALAGLSRPAAVEPVGRAPAAIADERDRGVGGELETAHHAVATRM